MRLNAVKVLGISITNTPKNEILKEIQKGLLQNRKNTIIFTPNTEQIVFAYHHPAFVNILNKADISLPDSIGVAITAGTHRIAGVDFMEELVQLASNRHVPIGLIGGRDNLAVDTLHCLRQKYTLLQDSWAEDGPEIETNILPDVTYFERLGRRIVREGTRIVFVALGPPKQEFFIERLSRELSTIYDLRSVILMAVGGSFDILSGRLPRAPLWMRTLGLEWLWRLILEPRRIIRQLALIEFVWLVLREKLNVV